MNSYYIKGKIIFSYFCNSSSCPGHNITGHIDGYFTGEDCDDAVIAAVEKNGTELEVFRNDQMVFSHWEGEPTVTLAKNMEEQE